MNYYIKGDKEKADKIKAAFEELGINVLGFGFADKAVVYCSIGECVQYLPYSINLMNILYSHPDYKELELAVKSKFKVGDKIEATIYGIKRRVTIREVDKTNRCYFGTLEECIGFSEQDKWHLAPKTHPDYKELELPVEPKFKVGDEIIWNEPKGRKPTEPVKIIQLIDKDQLYMVDMPNGVGYVAYDMQDYYKLVPKPHYDISNFHAGMPVLVRDNNKEWRYVPFSHITNGSWKFNAVGTIWEQCIPFKGNEHLLGTTDPCDEQYINW